MLEHQDCYLTLPPIVLKPAGFMAHPIYVGKNEPSS